MGSNNVVFTLVVFILVGIIFLLYSQLDYIMGPLFTIISAILTPLLISFILFYLFSPIIKFAEKKGVPKLWGIIILYVLVLGVFTLLLVWLIPLLQRQFEDLINTLPQLFKQVTDFITDIVNNFIVREDQQEAFQQGLEYFDNIEADIVNYISDGFSGMGSVLSSVTSALLIVFLVPVILFFLLKDGDNFAKRFMSKVPPKGRRDVASILAAIDAQVGNYVKGQMLIALINGVLMFIGFSIIGLNYSGVLAVAGGILSFVPYLGPTLTFVPAALIALSQGFWVGVQLIVVWIVIQFIEGNLVEPNVMGRRLNIHPLTIILVLLVMSELLGIIGMLIGVPLFAVIKVFFTYGFLKYQERYNRYYGDIAGEYNVESLSKTYDVEQETRKLAHVDIE